MLPLNFRVDLFLVSNKIVTFMLSNSLIWHWPVNTGI